MKPNDIKINLTKKMRKIGVYYSINKVNLSLINDLAIGF